MFPPVTFQIPDPFLTSSPLLVIQGKFLVFSFKQFSNRCSVRLDPATAASFMCCFQMWPWDFSVEALLCTDQCVSHTNVNVCHIPPSGQPTVLTVLHGIDEGGSPIIPFIDQQIRAQRLTCPRPTVKMIKLSSVYLQ